MRFDPSSAAAPEVNFRCASPERNVTRLLREWSAGDPAALDQLTPLVYDELHRLARIRLIGESLHRSLQPSALVHEAYLKLMEHTQMSWQNRAHFFAIAATIMRRILIDDARRRNAEKRGRRLQITLQEDLDASDERPADVLAVDLALQGLAKIDERKSRVEIFRRLDDGGDLRSNGYLSCYGWT